MTTDINLYTEYRAELDILYPLADTFQMQLLLNIRKGKPLRVRGSVEMALPILGDANLPLSCRVFASYIMKDSSWVLIKVRKDLWVLLAYDRKSTFISFFIIDSSKVSFNEHSAGNYEGMPLPKVLALVKAGIVKHYLKLKSSFIWKEAEGAFNLDAGQVPPDTKGVGVGAKTEWVN